MFDPFKLLPEITFVISGIFCLWRAYVGEHLIYDDGVNELSIIDGDRYRRERMTTRSRVALTCSGIFIIVTGLLGIWRALGY